MLRKEEGQLLSVLCLRPARRALGTVPLTLRLVTTGAVSVEGPSRM